MATRVKWPHATVEFAPFSMLRDGWVGGKETAGKETAGKETAGKETAGKETAGKETRMRLTNSETSVLRVE
jgi:hypothetical protein